MTAGKYYITPDGDPYGNMALDEWAFRQVSDGRGRIPAILRLYTWNKGAITFGYNQKLERAVDFSLLDKETPVIRRITGGRAIYHDPTELTFSLALDTNILSKQLRSLSATNSLISDALVELFLRLGRSANWLGHSDSEFAGGSKGRLKSCFSSVSKFEVIDGRNKIAGGAQRHIGDFLIHQGSIKINGVSNCPAVAQEGDPALFNPGEKDDKNNFYTIDHFSPIFGIVFAEKLGLIFERAEFLPKEREEIISSTVNLIEKCLEKR
ncbi:MAG: hypothetical protein CVT49_00815 [candidate division Zixibacteria bacterium HGW-Zixibacteria-1]|nr:MAG: hypothetical protein CVT49_00815 [candidate division Zixibacteria bacterium HGW-Zixibacteria-1]